jgi:hypothetical protein
MEDQLELFASDATNMQVGGSHYLEMPITPTEYIIANDMGWLEGNAVKYISRHKRKNGRQDIEKAIHYCHLILEHFYKD